MGLHIHSGCGQPAATIERDRQLVTGSSGAAPCYVRTLESGGT